MMKEKVAKIAARYIRAQARENSADFNPDIRALFALEEVLLPLSRAQRNLTRAFTLFVQMKTPKITPDGMIGGRGFVMPLKEAKDTISATIESLARVIDAVDDEITNNPVWKQLKKKHQEQKDKEEAESETQYKEKVDFNDIEEDFEEDSFLTMDQIREMEETGRLPEMSPSEAANEAARVLKNEFEEELRITP